MNHMALIIIRYNIETNDLQISGICETLVKPFLLCREESKTALSVVVTVDCKSPNVCDQDVEYRQKVMKLHMSVQYCD